VTYGVVTYDDASATPPHAIKVHAAGPGHLRIEPVRPGSRDVTITLDP
jgi:hypothetical protein